MCVETLFDRGKNGDKEYELHYVLCVCGIWDLCVIKVTKQVQEKDWLCPKTPSKRHICTHKYTQ